MLGFQIRVKHTIVSVQSTEMMPLPPDLATVYTADCDMSLSIVNSTQLYGDFVDSWMVNAQFGWRGG